MTLSGTVPIGQGVSVFVGVQQVPGRGGEAWGKLELNPARYVDPDGVGLAPVVELPTALAAAWRAAHELVEPAGELAEASVKRLDLARDFEAAGDGAPGWGGFYVHGLLGVHRPWARKSLVFNDASRGQAETLFVGSGAGVCRLYDKGEEVKGHKPRGLGGEAGDEEVARYRADLARWETKREAAAGVLRWEVEARSRWLSRYGDVGRVRDVTVPGLEALARNRWEWSAMGREVAGLSRVVDVVAGSGLSAAKQRALLGHLMFVAAGKRDAVSKEKAAEFSRQAGTLGISMAPGTWVDDLAGIRGRLDLDSGREVLTAA